MASIEKQYSINLFALSNHIKVIKRFDFVINTFDKLRK